MASLAFLALASANAAGVAAGTAVAFSTSTLIGGGIMAGFIDNVFLLPGLFPPPDARGPKFDDTGIQSASEGAPINRCYGLASRMSGQVIWMGEMTEVSSLAATTGKGGGFQVAISTYKRDVAVAFCGNEVFAVDRIHADGKLLWTEDPSIAISATNISAVNGPGGQMELRQVYGGGFEDLSLSTLYSGQNAIVAGFSRLGTFSHANPAGPNVLFFQGAHTATDTTLLLDANGTALSGTIAVGDGFLINHGGGIGTIPYVVTIAATMVTGGTLVTVRQKKEPGAVLGLAANVANDTQITITSSNNGTYIVQSTGIDFDGAFEWARFEYFFEHTHAAGDTVTIDQTGIAFDPAKVDSVTVYTGTDYQDPDPVIESVLGVTQVPGFRGRTYVVFEGLVLTDYGNRVPNFTARCTASTDATYDGALATMMSETGLPAAYYDVSEMDSQCPGYIAQGPLAASQAMQPYLVSGEMVAREESGVLKFYPRADVPTIDIAESDLGAHEEGGSSNYPVTVTDRDDLEVPNAVTLTFLDIAKDYQSGSVTEKAPGVASRVASQMRLPIALSTAQARDIAQHGLYNARTNRHRLATSLPPSYIGDGISENMLASLTALGEDMSILTQRVELGADWLIKIEGVREDTSVGLFAESDDAPLDVAAVAQVQSAPSLRFQVLDIAPMSDAHSDRLGFYVAGSSYQPNRWRGATLFASSDSGTTYKRVATLREQAVMGVATTALADGPVGYLDRAATVTVVLDSGELESVEYADCLKGANRMWIGGEIIGFTTATLTATKTYELSGLLRGLRDTRGYTAGHAEGETVVMLGDGVHFIDTNSASVGVARLFKLVANGGIVSDVTAQSVRLQGRTMMPFAPVHIAGTRDVSDNLTLTWVRRSRRLVDILGDTRAASADVEAARGYEVDVMSGSTVLRTLGSTTETVAYSAANQTTDGLTLGDPVTVRVYAVSEVVGRGNYTEETV